ncbi:MAG TPA: DNA primase small subunit domain-containing protein [Candidatus Nanoarchaeia archaeon]|nr:DNA primase small subunit domain-containing protein [Candidatus Nanoarchaeia archaeon]
MLNKSITLKYYKRLEIQRELVQHAENKEVGLRYNDSFGSRPDILTYPRDVIELALKGLTSFHASEELWENPLALNSNLSKKELDQLRLGWDLVLDIDCAIMEYSRICADLIIQFLKYCQVQDVSCKFSGNKGFHIGVPFEAFPRQVGDKPTRELFPEAPKKIAFYIKENIKEELAKRIMQFENNDFNAVKNKIAEPDIIIRQEINSYGDKIAKLNVDTFLAIDTILISSRHLYRMPYSLHEKSGLVSLPLNPEKVLEFEKPLAQPEKVLRPLFGFLQRKVQGESARRLLAQALDFEVKLEEKIEKRNFEEINLESPIKEDFFPPCLKKLLSGMADGKKRGVFVLSNFLGKIGWSKDDIQKFITIWNEKNPEKLREVYLKGQLNSFRPGERLPPNCSNRAYYKDMGICHPDSLCSRIRNPVNYTMLRWRSWLRDHEEKK